MKQKWQIALFVGLVAVAAAIWYSNFSNRGGAVTVAVGNVSYPPLAVDNPQLHWWKIDAARKTDYADSRRNIFSPAAGPVPDFRKKTRPVPTATVQPPPLPPPVPTVAPLPMKFFGYAMLASRGPRRAFFTDGEEVFVVGEGETLLGRFRILRIGNTTLEYEEIATGLRGTAVLEEQGPGA